ncbi:MAG TPA: D-alanyl-D-alanine carboxypeptidase, partial [Saprospiraceae bacterium]|nr:D-alanyl-D-alanine carboxypeptidase [Saprospiraceae bacterium]
MTGCSSQRPITHSLNKPQIRIWDSLDLASIHHIGLAIYDLNKEKYIFEHQSSHLFTPASNTKLLTMYAALLSIGDSIPAAYYQQKGDTLFVWGGGDPGTKYPDINSTSLLVNFLNRSEKTIIFSNHHFQTERFGHGWAWDDYTNSFQPERTAFPIYGNRVWVERVKDS